jgi:hypothetical protein
MTIGDPREAVDIGRQAVADAAMLNSRRMNDELFKLVRACERHRSIPEVVELSADVTSAMSDV